MKRHLFLFFTLLISFAIKAQKIELASLQREIPNKEIEVKTLYSDQQASSFLIWINEEVKAHKHMAHSEQVYVLEGKGEMHLGSQVFKVKKGDFVFIPLGTVHAVKVTSKKPMKVLSIQAPEFDGTDRVLVD